MAGMFSIIHNKEPLVNYAIFLVYSLIHNQGAPLKACQDLVEFAMLSVNQPVSSVGRGLKHTSTSLCFLQRTGPFVRSTLC